MKAAITHLTDRPATARRWFIAILAALHFVAAPCVMAMTAAAGEEACEHCDAGRDTVACASTAIDAGTEDAAPAPGSVRLPDAPGAMALLPAPAIVMATALLPAGHREQIGRETGRHPGDPPLTVLYGKFLN